MGVGWANNWKKAITLEMGIQYKYVTDLKKPKYKARLIAKGVNKNMGSITTRYSRM